MMGFGTGWVSVVMGMRCGGHLDGDGILVGFGSGIWWWDLVVGFGDGIWGSGGILPV
ncbi:hypothetical protein Tco_0476896, partial [Tanacetum coccineum]